MDFSNRLKNEREILKMTQQELGEKIGVSKQTISVYENGTKFPTVHTLVKIADVFDCSIDYLLCRTNNKELAIVEYEQDGKQYKVEVNKNKSTEIDLIKAEVQNLLNRINDIEK